MRSSYRAVMCARLEVSPDERKEAYSASPEFPTERQSLPCIFLSASRGDNFTDFLLSSRGEPVGWFRG